MRNLLSAIALAVMASAGQAQQLPQAAPTPSVAPECRTSSGSAPAQSTNDSLCLARGDAITLALSANPQLQIAGAQAMQARAARTQGVAFPDPSFGAEWDGAKGPFGVGGASSRVFGASVTIPYFDKFRLNGRIGTAGIKQTEADSLTIRQSIASQTSQAYDAVLTALRHRDNLREADSLTGDFLQKTQARFDAGTVPRLDVLNAQVALAQAQNDLISNEREIADARSSLNRFLGRALGAPFATSDTLGVPSAIPALVALENAALGNRPELTSLQHQQQGARATTELAREYWLPDFTIGISKDYLADATPGYLTTGISFPIPLLYRNHSKGEIAVAKFREDELAATYRDLQAAIGQEVRMAYSAAATALRQAVFLRDQLLPAARQAYRIAAASYALGGLSALEVNSARTTLVGAESQYTDALAAANAARAELERAVATPLATLGTGGSQ